MPLIQTYQTDLKSLRYGQDRPGGGSSNQPYHKVNYRKKFELGTEGLAQTGGSDLILRGGYLTFGVPGYANSRIGADLERIGKWFASAEGLVWIGQQNILSQLGTRIYGGYPTQVRAANSARLNDGVYTPISTLAAVAGNAIGTHPNKQGLDPTGLSATGRPEYIKLVRGGITNTGTFEGIANIANNRLVNLYRTKITDYQGAQSTELYQYKGGPQSGEGLQLNTIINTASSRTIFKSSNIIATGTDIVPLSYITWDQSDFSRLNYNSSRSYFVVGNGTTTTVQDFRKILLLNGAQSNISLSPNYKTRNIEKRVNLGDPGARGVNRGNYQNGIPQNYRGLDSLNALYLYKSANVNNTDVRTNDLVKFRIAVIDNDNPRLKTFTHLRSFINSFDDNMSSTWDSFKYLGRGEDFYTYKGFSRSNNISFTLMAQSVQELSVMYQKLNYLISSLAPDYSEGGYMRGNLVQLTLGAYFYEMPGIIENITITIPNDTTWEIGIPPSEGDSSRFAASPTKFTARDTQELPHRLEISLTFRPIHNFIPEIVKNINGGQNIKQRFLSLANANPDYKGGNFYGDGVNDVFKISQPTNLVPDEPIEINEIPLLDFATNPEEDVVPLIPGTLRLNRQVNRPGLGIGELSDEELLNLGN